MKPTWSCLGTFFYGAFLVRFVIVLALVPWVLGFLSIVGFQRLFLGLVVMDRRAQLFNVTWLCFLIATFVLVAFQVIYRNAPDRYQSGLVWEPPVTPSPWRWRWPLLIAMGLFLPVVCLVATLRDLMDVNQLDGRCDLFCWGSAIVGGTAMAAVMLYAWTALQMLLIHPQSRLTHLLPFESWWGMDKLKKVRIPWVDAWNTRLAACLCTCLPGYTKPQDPVDPASPKVIAPGHSQAALWFATTLIVYLFTAIFLQDSERVPAEGGRLPTLFYLLVLILLAGVFLPGISFFLDRFRVPVFTSLLLVGWLISWNFDHYYVIPPQVDGGSNQVSPLLVDVMKARYAPHPMAPTGEKPSEEPRVDPQENDPHGRTLVVVTAAGGGIQAAAWTARVLTGLDELYGDRFTRSIGLISSVSGGSVGTMHYVALGKWSSATRAFKPATRDRVNALACASCLEAVGWGLAYPDSLRMIVPFLVPAEVDRGWAVEMLWRRKWRQLPSDETPVAADLPPLHDTRLKDWAKAMSKGEMPVVVFNATLVETGQRLLISPVQAGIERQQGDQAGAVEFCNRSKDNGLTMHVATASRLSATFPYVTPIARSEPDYDQNGQCRHVADGGYVDNEGIFTVAQWINHLLSYYADDNDGSNAHSKDGKPKRPFQRVLIVRIQPFPPTSAETVINRSGWRMATIGPLDTMMAVRTTSQIERNNKVLELLCDLWNDDWTVNSDARATPLASPGAAKSRMLSQSRSFETNAWVAQQKLGQTMQAQRSSSKSQATDRAQMAFRMRGARDAPKAAAAAPDARAAQKAQDAVQTQETIEENQQAKAKLLYAHRYQLPIVWTEFIYDPYSDKSEEQDDDTPLSWKLTRRQQQNIEKAWNKIVKPDCTRPAGMFAKPPLETIQVYFDPVSFSKSK